MVRQLLVAGAIFFLLGLPVACGGGEGEPAGISPGPGVVSGPSSQAAPDEGTFLIDLSTDRWIQVLPTFNKYLTEVSPDGETILYRVSPAADTEELFAIEADGSNRRKIADGPLEAAFSPDGKTLAMWGQDRPLTLMDWPDGELVETAVPAGVRVAVWSSTNELAAFTVDQTSGETDVYFVTREGTVEGEAARVAWPGSWAPDGSRLAFAHEDQVFTITPGQAPDVLAQIPGARAQSLSWSHDGALLAVHISRPATADPRYATTDTVVIDATTGETRFTLVSAGNFEASWSPAEPVLLFDGNACRFEDWQLMLVNGDGTGLRPLSERHGGSLLGGYGWSPDGAQIATTSVESDTVTAVDVETGAAQSVFRSPGILVDLQWVTPDRLLVSTTSGTDACVQDLGETTQVVFP